MRSKRPRIGAHVSAAGGIFKAFENAKRLGAECIQIFGASPRQWAANLPLDETIKKYKDYSQKSDIHPVFLHAAYLINLASFNDEIRAKSQKCLKNHLQIAEAIEAAGVIFHIGPGKDAGAIINSINEILMNVPGKSFLVIENSANNQSLGHSLEQISHIYKSVKSKRVKICLDTAHLFESGQLPEFTPKSIKFFFDRFDSLLGIENLVALHINDSKTKANSSNDRHENIGDGYIGIEGFKNLAKEKRLHDKAWILEVPGSDDNGPDKNNVDILKSLFAG